MNNIENFIIELKNKPFINSIMNDLNGEVFAVGGIVRDLILNKKSKDIDLVIRNVSVDNLIKHLQNFGKIDIVGKSFGVIKLIDSDGIDYDIALPRKEQPNGDGGHRGFEIQSDPNMSIEDDLIRRDVKFNAMAINLNTGKYIDPLGGLDDIENKQVSAANPDAFSDDPLRMFRVISFASRFGFTIEPHTMEMIKKSLDSVSKIAMDRRYIELNKIREKGDMQYGAQLLKDSGLFRKLFGYELNQSIIDNAPFDKVNTTAEFIFLILQESQNPEELFKTRIHNLNDDYKFIKALNVGYKANINHVIAARSIAHNMHLVYPKSLESDILPDLIKTAANELLDGKYPKTVNELAVNGNDLMELGLQGKSIRDMQNKILLAIYADKIINNKEELIDMAKKNQSQINEKLDAKTLEKAKKNIPIKYTGIVVDDLRKDRLLTMFGSLIPDDWTVVDENMHVTIKLGGLDDFDPMKYLISYPIYVSATHIGVSDKAVALKVNIETEKIKSKNDIPHITLAYNENAGAKAKDSNYITDWQELKRPIKIRGVFQEVPEKLNI